MARKAARKRPGCIVALIVIGASTFAMLPGPREAMQWRTATRQDRAAGYASYLARWPNGPHANEAEARHDDRSWDEARASKAADGLARYLQDHADGRHVAAATRLYDEYLWEEAKTSGTLEGFARYLQQHPADGHAEDAESRVEAIHWGQASASNTTAALTRYRDLYPSGRFVSQAMAAHRALLADDTPFLRAREQGTERAWTTFLAEFAGHRRAFEARTALEALQGRDIVDLIREGKIEVETRGAGIESLVLRLRRRVPYPITVRVPVGTYFVAAQASAQNMVSTADAACVLRNDEWTVLRPAVTCANRPKRVPGNGDTFTVQRSPQQEQLRQLMPVLSRARADFSVRQAAVWIVTDNADYDDLGSLVSRPAFTPAGMGGGTRSIGYTDAAKAMQICERAGIDLRTKAIWGDRSNILKHLRDGVLKAWLTTSTGSSPAPALAPEPEPERGPAPSRAPITFGAHAIKAGQSREHVLSILGPPRGTSRSGTSESLLYNGGWIDLVDDKVVEVHLR